VTNPAESFRTGGASTSVLITGGCGFIGTNLTRFLGVRGYLLTIVDDLSNPCEAWASGWMPEGNVRLVKGDVSDSATLSEALMGVSSVVHLAACTDVIGSLQDPWKAWRVNVGGTLNLMECCRKASVDRVVFASSNAVLGNHVPPARESAVAAPLSVYGASKLAGEALCSAYYHSFGLDTFCLRFSNCYGSHSERKTSVVNRFMVALMHESPLIVYGDGTQTRDFVHVDDVCQAIHLALGSNMKGGRVFHIGSGVETSIGDLVSVLSGLLGRTPEIEYRPRRRGEIERNYSDISLARELLGFVPTVTLEDGLKRLCNWCKTKSP
jgi:UDP-glucose 4-epimerase